MWMEGRIMKSAFARKTVLFWGLILTGVLSVGAVAGELYSGTCMFILMPFFAGLAALMPAVRLRSFGVTVGTYIPYSLIGFFPLYFFDYVQSKAIVGLWAVILFSASGLLIGLAADAAWAAGRRLGERGRAAAAGAVLQAATFLVMLLGFRYLYVASAAPGGHLHFFTREWFFTLPWMAVNGAFGGYMARMIWEGQAARRGRATAGITERR
jgi:hypothetical protein